MAFNPEAACKANDNRLNGLERTVENIQKDLRQNGTKGLEDRLTKLEAVVKSLGESKGDINKISAMDKTVRALEAAKLVDQNTAKSMIDAANKKANDDIIKASKEETKAAIADAMKQVMETRIKILEAKVASMGR